MVSMDTVRSGCDIALLRHIDVALQVQYQYLPSNKPDQQCDSV